MACACSPYSKVSTLLCCAFLPFGNYRLIFSSAQSKPLGRLRCAIERKRRAMSVQLPDPIERYVQIVNSGTAEAAPECFAPDAIVHDRGQTYEGVAAIKNWLPATKKNYAQTVVPSKLAGRSG